MSVPAAVLLTLVAALIGVALLGSVRERRRVERERLAAPMVLREAARHLDLSLDVLRRASTRDPRFPAPVGTGPRGAGLYRLPALRDWSRSRPGRPATLQRGVDLAAGRDTGTYR